MYKIYAIINDERYLLHDPRLKNLRVGTPYFEIGDNLNGQAEFSVYKTHPNYDYVQKLVTDVVFYDGSTEVFRGRVLYDDETMNGTKKVFVEGQLAFLCDSIQRPAVYHNVSVASYLGSLLANHNAQVEERKQFQLGTVTVVDSNDSIYRYSNYETTRKCITDKLTDRLGGHLVVRWSNGVRYLDYLADADFYTDCAQKIQFGKNMLDFSRTITAADLATCVIPLGCKLPEDQQDETLQDQRLTIESVNDGVDYVYGADAVATFGKIYTTVINDDITVAANLLTYGREYLESVQYAQLVLEMKAIDLGLADTTIEKFGIGKRIRCVSKPHAMDVWLPLSKMKVYITNFAKNTVTIGSQSALSSYTTSNSAQQKVVTEEMSEIKNVNTAVIAEVRSKVTSEEVTTIISANKSNVRLDASSIAWVATYSSMTSDGTLQSTGAILTSPAITDPTITSNNGTEKLTVTQAVVTGYHSDTQAGYLNLSSAKSHDNGVTTTYDAVIGSADNVVFEAGSNGLFYFYKGGTLCGYIDTDGWHAAASA